MNISLPVASARKIVNNLIQKIGESNDDRDIIHIEINTESVPILVINKYEK